MTRFGFHSLFTKLFASVMLTLVLFAIAMIALTHLVHDNSTNTRWQVLAKQITKQIDPFLADLNAAEDEDNRLHARFMLAVIKKSFDIFDESLQAKLGLYDVHGHLLIQTDNSDLPLLLPDEPSWLSRMIPSFSNKPINNQVQAVSHNGYTLLYESRNPPQRSEIAAAFNLLTGTMLLLIFMTIVLWWIAHSMTWRIDQMSQQIRRLGEGDFSVRVPDHGTDEIADLAHGFNQAAQKIEQLINANNLLLAHASHELRTPITRIRLQVEMMDMLASGLPETTKQKFDKRAAAINSDLTGLNDLVESILLVSRLDAGHAAQQNERLDLYELVSQECQHYNKAILIGDHLVMQGQPQLLIHLIRNLLNNALIHGVPPITVQVYGIMQIEDALNVPSHIVNNDTTALKNLTEETSLEQAANAQLEHSQLESSQLEKRTLHVAPSLEGDRSSKNSETHRITAKSLPKNETPESLASDTETATVAEAQASPSSDTDDAMCDFKAAKSDTTPKTKKLSLLSKKDKPRKVSKDSNKALLADHIFNKRRRKPKAVEQPKFAVIAVIDQGTGIPSEKREDIFSPFVRLQQKKKGSGLGLSLVAQIVEAHHGKIITDTLQGHTRFLVILPTNLKTLLESNGSR